MEHAKAISLTEILSMIGYAPFKKVGKIDWYYSPLLGDNLSLFQVDTERNTWRDFGLDVAGDTICFVSAYLKSQDEDHTRADAMRWLENMIPQNLGCNEFCLDDADHATGNFVIETIAQLTDQSHLGFLYSQGIPMPLAKQFLKDAGVSNCTTGKSFSALAMVNENGGYNLFNHQFKACVAPQGVSVLRGTVMLPPEVHVFKNVMDFLSMLADRRGIGFEGDTIILNSLSNLSKAFPYIKDYSYGRLFTYLDNTPASQKASEILDAFCARQPKKIVCQAMNQTYAGFRDVSSWHRSNLGLIS